MYKKYVPVVSNVFFVYSLLWTFSDHVSIRNKMEWRGFYYQTHHIVQGICFLCRLGQNMFIKELYIHFSWIDLPDRSYNCFRMSFAEKGHFIMSLTQFPYFFPLSPHITPIRHIWFGRPHILHFRFAKNICSYPNVSKLLSTRHQRYVDLPSATLLCPLLRHNELEEICR